MATLKTDVLIFRHLIFSWPGKMGSRSQLFFFSPCGLRCPTSSSSKQMFLDHTAKSSRRKSFKKYIGLSCPVDTNAFRKLKVAPRTAMSGLAFRYLVAE